MNKPIIPIVDPLTQMFLMQLKFQQDTKQDIFSQQYYSNMTQALVDETMEALRETNWKPWKRSYGQPLDAQQVKCRKEELVDCWHFLINLSLAAGMSADDVHQAFLAKHKVNQDRQKQGY